MKAQFCLFGSEEKSLMLTVFYFFGLIIVVVSLGIVFKEQTKARGSIDA